MPPPPALSQDNPYLGMRFTKISLLKQGVFSNFGPEHATQVSGILDDCLTSCAKFSDDLVFINNLKITKEEKDKRVRKPVKDFTTTVQNLTDVIKFFNTYIKEDGDFEKKLIDFRYVEDGREGENILRVVVCCRFLHISDRIDFVRAINGIANKETKKSIAFFKYDDEDNAIDCVSFEETLHINNIRDDSRAQIEQLLKELAKLTVTDTDLDAVSDVFLGKTLLDDDNTVTSDLSRPSTSSSSDSSRPSTPSSSDSSTPSTSFSSDSSIYSTSSTDSSRPSTSSGRVSPTSSGRVSPTSSGRVSPVNSSNDYGKKFEPITKIKPVNTSRTSKVLPFSFSKGGKKKTRKQKRKRATRRRARR
jgi:hypothetical protein